MFAFGSLSEQDMEDGFQLLLEDWRSYHWLSRCSGTLSISCNMATLWLQQLLANIALALWINAISSYDASTGVVQSMVGCFLARAVVDEVLPPAVLGFRIETMTVLGIPWLRRSTPVVTCTRWLGAGWVWWRRPVAELKLFLDHSQGVFDEPWTMQVVAFGNECF
jgi:hypothetical protein